MSGNSILGQKETVAPKRGHMAVAMVRYLLNCLTTAVLLFTESSSDMQITLMEFRSVTNTTMDKTTHGATMEVLADVVALSI